VSLFKPVHEGSGKFFAALDQVFGHSLGSLLALREAAGVRADPETLACEIAARRHGLWDEQGSFAEQGRRARELIKQLNRDADARAPGSTQTPPLPRAQALNVQTSVGQNTNVWNRIADYKDTGGF
jgi:hypothetical protein